VVVGSDNKGHIQPVMLANARGDVIIEEGLKPENAWSGNSKGEEGTVVTPKDFAEEKGPDGK
jgi:hypothetical protein